MTARKKDFLLIIFVCGGSVVIDLLADITDNDKWYK